MRRLKNIGDQADTGSMVSLIFLDVSFLCYTDYPGRSIPRTAQWGHGSQLLH